MSINGRIKAFREMSLARKIIYAVVAVAVVAGVVMVANYTREAPTRAFLQLPYGRITMVNAEGVELPLDVRMVNTPAARREGLKNVRQEVATERPVLFHYRVNTAARHIFSDLRMPIDVAFFTEEGTLLETHTNVESGQTVIPDGRYRFLLIAEAGYLTNNEIGAQYETILVPDTLTITAVPQ